MTLKRCTQLAAIASLITYSVGNIILLRRLR